MNHLFVSKINHLLISFCLLAFASTQANAQVTQDASPPKVEVKLKNGSIIKGKYVSLIPDQSLSITLYDRDTIFLPWQTIKSFKMKEAGSNLTKSQITREGLIIDKVKFTGRIGLLGNNQLQGIGASVGALYILNSRFMSGVSVGVSNYSQNDGENILNIGNESRFYILPSAVSPFFYMKTGYGFAFASDKYNISQAKGAMYYNPGLGFSFGHNFAFELLIGLNFQRTSFAYGNGESTSTIERNAKRVEIGIGFSF